MKYLNKKIRTSREKLSTIINPKRKAYAKLQTINKPVSYHLPADINIELNPKGQIAELLYTMDFEFDLLERVAKFLKPGMSVVDIGANIGLYSILASKLIGDTGMVWAFEPASDVYQMMQQNLSLNNVQNVKIFKHALASQDDQKLNLMCEDDLPDGHRFTSTQAVDQIEAVSEINTVESVMACTLDKVIRDLKNPKIDFIKIDVEGYEYDILKGMRETLLQNENVLVLFESSEKLLERAGASQNELNKYMQELGFTLHAWDNKKQEWATEIERVNKIGNVWACRDDSILP